MNKPDASLRFTVLLGVLIALPALGTDMFVPVLPALAQAFQVPVSAAQLPLTTFFIGLAAGQLLWGPLSDRFGRKRVLVAGLLIMLLASLVAAAMNSLAAVAAARLVQGFGMASGGLMGRTIVRDLYAHEKAAWMLARMNIVFSVIPIVAPITGALVADSAGWRAVFAAIAVVAALLMISIIGLRETAPAERRSVHPAAILATFVRILGDRRFLAPYVLILCTQIGVLAWVANSAFTLVRGFGVSAVAFGFMFAAVMTGQIAGSWASSRLVMRLGIPRLMRVGVALMLASGATAAALAWLGAHHWVAVVLPFTVFLFGTALLLPNAYAAALTPFPESAGSATSIIGCFGFTAGALISTVLGAAFDGSARPLATAAALAGLAAFVFERSLSRGKA